MAESNSVARSLHDLGLAAWFGGSLMGAVGVNSAAAKATSPKDRLDVANAAWAAWTPVNLAAIGLHGAGAVTILIANRKRVAAQKGVAGATILKTVLTAGAVAATGYSRVLGEKLMQAQDQAGDISVSGGAEPNSRTPKDVAQAQQQLRILQWAIPALTGAVLVVNARMGEQQRPASVASGVVDRLRNI